MHFTNTVSVTESRNPASEKIDILPTLKILQLINNEDKKVAVAVRKALPDIAKAVDMISHAFKQGGRLVYCGAGTSGRLGVLDASECPPTYGVDENLVIALIAGGEKAMFKAIEQVEDNPILGQQDLKEINFSSQDILVGIAASGRTPYVVGALEYAQEKGAKTIVLVCNQNCTLSQLACLSITTLVGSEVITGSSRMKAGTAQKMVLNMLTTGAMIKLGKVYSNLMVDVVASNQKLINRQKNIIMQATGCDINSAEATLVTAKYNCKVAILMLLAGLEVEAAEALLQKSGGYIRVALSEKTS